MLQYTANDVLYLPKVYSIIKKNFEEGVYKNFTFKQIEIESSKYLEYTKINLTIKNFNKISIEKDKEVEGLLKNFQKNCIFVQLNIGYNGIVTNKITIQTLSSKYKIGDILNFKIIKLDDTKKRYILDFHEKLEVRETNQKENIMNNASTKLSKKNWDNVVAFFPSSLKNQKRNSFNHKSYSNSKKVNLATNDQYHLNNNNTQSNLMYYYPNNSIPQGGYLYYVNNNGSGDMTYSHNNVTQSIDEDKSIYDIDTLFSYYQNIDS